VPPRYARSMCTSYGIDPGFTAAADLFGAGGKELLRDLHLWATSNAAETLLPTGRHARNRNPIVVGGPRGPRPEAGWWGYLAGGEPVRYASVNTRSERLLERSVPVPGRALVPATHWFETHRGSRRRFRLGLDGLEAFTMAAVTRPGVPRGDRAVTCYSILTQPAAEHLTAVHDRMPVLLPPALADEWLTGRAPSHELVPAALEAGRAVARRVMTARVG